MTKLSSDWPKFSIVTPSYNQAQFLEDAIQSVLTQEYPNLEYIIIDGGSTDQSVEIIKKYDYRLTYWVSAPDNGQSEAINKGVMRATGEWVSWLNSDDMYLPGTLVAVAEEIKNNPAIHWIVGSTLVSDTRNTTRYSIKPHAPGFSGDEVGNLNSSWLDYVCTKNSRIQLPQPSSFWSREAWCDVGGLNLALHYAMDHELYGRLAYLGYRPHCMDRDLALFRVHGNSKTSSGQIPFFLEEVAILDDWIQKAQPAEVIQLSNYRKQLMKIMKKYGRKQKLRSSSFYQFIKSVYRLLGSSKADA